jgi:glycosyltransferase involved in cell wall biosynthesis
MKPLLSVITPSLNAREFLPDNVASVAALATPQEHIVIDGGSGDGTVGFLRGQELPGLRWVSEPDRGQTHAVNKGLEMARGGLVAWLNADDVYIPEAVDGAVELLVSNPDLDAVYGFMEIVDRAGRRLKMRRCGPFSWWRYLYLGGYIPTPTIIFRRRLLAQAPRLDERFVDAADYDFALRLLRGANVRRVRRAFVKFRFHPDSKTGSRIELQLREAMEIRLRMARNPAEQALMRVLGRLQSLRDGLFPPWPRHEAAPAGEGASGSSRQYPERFHG